mgnify:CR=1 FL=1
MPECNKVFGKPVFAITPLIKQILVLRKLLLLYYSKHEILF